MKKIKYIPLLFIAILALFACSTNEEAVTTNSVIMPESAKAPEVITFKNALIENIKAKHEAKDKPENNADKIKIDADFFEASKTFLLASGISQIEVDSKAKQNEAEIQKMALALLAQKTAAIHNN